jgi:integrase
MLRLLRDRSFCVSEEDSIFCYRGGKMFGETWWRKRFDSFCKRAGIDREGRSLKPHSFRHTLTTYLTEKLQNRGMNPDVLNDSLGGWTNDKTRKRYTHVEEIIFEAQRTAAEELIGIA